MTPEQLKNTMDFIVRNHADAMVRMDRFDEELKEQKVRVDALVEAGRKQLEHNSRMEEIVMMLTEIQASQAVRLKWIEDHGV